jgi:uncharacterized membrane protein YhaH (DUF805 family)
MGFGDAVRTCFQKYAEFKGRASRPEYWWFFLSYVIVYIVGALIVGAVRGLAFLLWIILIAYFIPLLAAAVRRLHDTGRSGWWYLIGLIPLVGFIILIVLLAGEGQPATNEYGPPPGMAGGGALPTPPPPPPA